MRFIIRVESELKRLTKEFGDVTTAAETAQSKMSKAGANMQQTGQGMQSAGQGLAMGVTLPLIGVGAQSVRASGDFNSAMSVLKASSGASAAEIEKLSALAMDMGKKTVFSASESAGAMVELSKQGFTPAQIEGGALAATMSLAAAEGMALNDAATITANAMNVFGMEAGDAGKIADALAGGANASSASVESLAIGMSQSALAAKNAGLSLNENVGILAAFDEMGLKGSDAGTSLRTMLTRLVPTTDEASDAMKKYGLDFTDAQGNILPFADVAGQLQTQLGGLSEEQKIAALQTIFGQDAMRAATVAMGLGADGVNKYVTATEKSGEAQKMAEARMRGSKGAIEEMSGSLDTAAVQMGQGLEPTVIRGAKAIEGLANWFTGLSGAGQKTVITIAAIAAVIPILLIGAGMLVSAIGKIIAAEWLWTAATKALAAAKKGLAAVMKVLNVVMAMNPFGLIVLAIMAVVAAVIWLWRENEAFRNALIVAWNAIKAAGSAVWGALKAAWAAIVTVFRTGGEKVRAFFASLGQRVMSALATIMNIPTVLAARWQGILTSARDIFGRVVSFIREQIDKIKGFFSGLKLGLPKIKLPRFSVTGSFSLNPPRVPRLAVEWFASGGSFAANRPMIVGVGDQSRGREHILRDDQIVALMSRAIKGNSGGGTIVNVDARGATAADALAIGDATGTAVANAVKAKRTHLRLMTSGA